METGAKSDVGLVRKTNQDNYHLGPVGGTDYYLMAVADGMGGHAAGEVASRIAVETLRQVISGVGPWNAEPPDPEAIRRALIGAFSEANERVFQLAAHLPEYRGMGTTLTSLLVPSRPGRPAVFCHIGDSRAYLISEGRVRQITDDHSFVGQMVKDGDLTEAEAMNHPHRNILTKALGTEERVNVDSGIIEVSAGDTFITCSDGLSSLVTQDEVAAVVARGNLQEAVERLVRMALERGGSDNVTVVAARLSPKEGGR